MQFITLASLCLPVCTVLAQDVDWRDIPGNCSPVCWTVVNLSQGCAHTVDDNGYINCVCNNNAAADWIPNCEACIAAVWRNDSDVNSLLNSCSLSSTTWTGATTGTGTATAIPTGTVTTTESTGTSSTSTSTSGSATVTGTSASTTSSSTRRTTTAGASQTASTGSAFTGAAAPMATACLGMAAVLMGLPAML
ncbi:hypothetical protein GTA08_BOTSDO02856 [Botryosphaeria dothidea]|uniref:Uncharacterized protein n=1 Tax=Botryosphaeria dothidea TaxID=55169 RepID=A0A8H4N6K7_9PEZI|nr:hypothetical protein GTA08_BOTSDO02856 [Botryosphaeria dothidea]